MRKNKKQYQVAIVGAGPAGLFAAYELTKNKRKRSQVLIIEQGNPISKRKKTEVMAGVGGAGTFSDGKLHFTPVLSHEKLLDLFNVDEYQEYLNYVDKLFINFGVKSKYTPSNHSEAFKLVQHCQRHGIYLYIRRCKHVGGDVLPKIVSNIVKVLEKQGVKIICNTKVDELLVKNHKVCGLKCGGKIYQAEKYLIAPGRIGTVWLQEQAKKIGLDYSYQTVEMGVRIEFPAGIMEKHSNVMHENIYAVQTPTYDDMIRTFCPCPEGKVVKEDYGDYVSVNGFSNVNSKTKNSNFSLINVIQLTEPVKNTLDYAVSIAKTATTIGGGQPLVQRLADLRGGRRSTWERISRSYVIPTLKEVTPGDISMALPHRIVTNVLESLEILDRVLPGINSGSTLLYAPEIKLRGNRIKINKNMQTKIGNLFVAGDGAGISGNIVGAAISGILAAQGILKTIT